MSEQTQYLTKEGYKKIKKELDYLKKEKRPEIAERIKQAKEYGDISENAEYADAREEQSFTEGRILELEDVLKNFKIVDMENSDPNIVEIGDEIVIERDGAKYTYTIVGSNESDPPGGKISNESPLGQMLLGKRCGDEFVFKTPKGESIIKILKLNT